MFCFLFFSTFQYSFICLFYILFFSFSSMFVMYWILRAVYLQKWHHFFFFIQSRSIRLVFHTQTQHTESKKRKKRRRKMSIRSKFFLYYYIISFKVAWMCMIQYLQFTYVMAYGIAHSEQPVFVCLFPFWNFVHSFHLVLFT